MRYLKLANLILCSCVVCVLFSSLATATGAEIEQKLTFSAPKYVIEELTANLHSDGTVLAVSGRVRNMSYMNVRGYVIINLLDSGNSVILSTEADVNQKKSFPHGKAAEFELYINVANIPGIANVSIEFVTL